MDQEWCALWQAVLEGDEARPCYNGSVVHDAREAYWRPRKRLSTTRRFTTSDGHGFAWKWLYCPHDVQRGDIVDIGRPGVLLKVNTLHRDEGRYTVRGSFIAVNVDVPKDIQRKLNVLTKAVKAEVREAHAYVPTPRPAKRVGMSANEEEAEWQATHEWHPNCPGWVLKQRAPK